MSDGPAPFALPQRAPVRVREGNPRPATIGVPDRPPAVPAPERTAPERTAPERTAPVPTDETFWASIGDACLLPLRGPGIYWVFSIGALSVAVAILGMLASFMPFVGAA